MLPSGQATSPTFVARLARCGDAVDQAQWFEFLARYGELILSIARRHGLQRADCDDVLQDSLIEVTRSLESFEYDRARGRFRNYLRQVVLRATYRKIRQKYVANSQQYLEDFPGATEIEPGAGGDGEDMWELEWRRHHVRQALRTIEAEFNESNRTAFIMCTAQEHSPHAVAELLGISVDQVYQAKSRILKRLQAVIEQQVAQEG